MTGWDDGLAMPEPIGDYGFALCQLLELSYEPFAHCRTPSRTSEYLPGEAATATSLRLPNVDRQNCPAGTQNPNLSLPP